MARIVFDHVTKRYPGSQRGAVDDVNLTVPEGSLCMLLGTSGSGKTTLLRMVNRLIDPTSGQILIDDTPTTSQDPIELRRSIGYVIQQIGLFPHMTIAQNVRVVPSITGKADHDTDARVDELLQLVGLEPSEFRNRYPRQLSGGQQQRVGLARALAADPAVLLMDEPFGALDAITRERVQEQLRNIHRSMRKTILFVTHDVEEALKLGDQIAVIVDGKLLQADTPIALLTNPVNDVVRRLIGGDNILRQFEYIPVTQALEPITVADAERLPANTVLLTALLRLLQTQADALIIEDDGKPVGQITFATIYRGLRADTPAATPMTDDQVPATH
ncbi:MAG TPA: ABC transporter ATP-binding protein [Ktedonobacterales bacterium]|nr:ABC transporter ATP-binding protein [Ktedonobacterales bacterium]